VERNRPAITFRNFSNTTDRQSVINWRLDLKFFFTIFATAVLSAASASAVDVVLDGTITGRTFEGVGAVSAGASSRLLIDYPQPQQGQILDYLFKPNYGASLQHLKVEIGGGVNSTDGTEPTHMLTRTDQNYTRGYEWWLMGQATVRNPDIILDCLAWGAPGWIGTSNYYSQDMCDYIVNFINGAQKYYGLNFRFTGTHNESAINTSWIKLLRSTLNANGLQNVQLVAADEWGGTWNIVTNTSYGLLADPVLSNDVARVGAHYPGSASPASAQSCGIPLWASEDGIGGSTWAAARNLGKIYNLNYVTGKMIATEIWSPITSYYDILAASNSGLMRANTPWSGNYMVAPAIWITAHTTQFAFPGWKYLEGGASALLPLGGSLVTLKSTNNTDYSIIVETFDATAAQTIAFHPTNGLSTGTLNIWQSTQTNQFILIGQVVPANGTFTETFQPECVYTITTTSGQTKGGAVPPPAAAFPLPFKDNFESYGVGQTPKYFSDQAGTFEIFTRTDGQGQDLRQVLPQIGIPWAAQWYPYTLIGDASWHDYDVASDILIETNNGFDFVMGRVGSVPGFSNPVPLGYWLALNNSSNDWELHSASNLLASGPATFPSNSWHNLRLSMRGSSISCFVDGSLVTNVTDYSFSSGLAGIGCGWHGAQFDNFIIRSLHLGALNLAPSAVASASSIWSSAYAASYANDGDPTTRWNASATPATNEWLELTFAQPVRFSRTAYSQFGDRIEGYQVQHWNGAGWTTDVNGGSMGGFASDSFAAVTSSKVRLLLTNFTSSPSIYEFEVYNDSSPPNLALGAAASASSVWSSDYVAAYANDGNNTTRWNTSYPTLSNEWLELDFPQPTNFNQAAYLQYVQGGNRIFGYQLQHWNGSGWTTDVNGGTIGSFSSDSFPTVTSSKIRLLLTNFTSAPSLYEFQVFYNLIAQTPPLVSINEWMINNTRTVPDPANGQYEPWFELYNSGLTDVNLDGFYLSSSITNLFQARIPSGYVIPTQGFLLVWADGLASQNQSSPADLHVNFSLQQSGNIILFDSNLLQLDAVNLDAQPPDFASGSRVDGDTAVLPIPVPTPRQSNDQILALPPSLLPSDAAVVLSFNGLPFYLHRILTASSITGSTWSNLAGVSADGLGSFQYIDLTDFQKPKKFYRAVFP
jgi:galactosylceramidase